ncbi:MAG: serine/threonine protein kinase [Phycisphaerales bacterium]|nr:serine/threonine protein kinase [Phycisphaerales bacterium]
MTDGTPRLATEEREIFELASGTIVSVHKQYQVLQHLGEGGMGKVYKAFDPIMNRYVAMKVMKDHVPEGEQRRFRREARMCASFQHPNLVRVLDVGTTAEHHLYWFVMEFLEGRDILGAMQGGRTVPLHVVCEIFRQVLDALRYIHLRGVVHRDVKPANIFITHDAHDPELRIIKLLDFGVARDASDDAPEDPRLILGDPRYLPPEQSRPQGPVDARSDLYALGMTFYEAVTGHHPFEDVFGQHPRALLECQRERNPEPPSRHLSSNADPRRTMAIDAFFRKACAKDPAQRFPDARTMQQALVEVGRYA